MVQGVWSWGRANWSRCFRPRREMAQRYDVVDAECLKKGLQHDSQKRMETLMAGSDDAVIITCALTGGIHGKEANRNLPEQPDEIVAQGRAAWQAGAAILHIHAR